MGKLQTIDTNKDIAEGLSYLRTQSAQMRHIIDATPIVPLRRRAPGFESLASIIISQQVSKQSAEAIFGRMQKLINPLTAENYLKVGESTWIEIGLSRPKQRTFLALCSAITQNNLRLAALGDMQADQAIASLTSVKGIGPWTAEVYLLFAIGHQDIFPAGDLALQIAATEAFNKNERYNDKELRHLAESWAPWRGVAARLLWAYYATLKGKNATP